MTVDRAVKVVCVILNYRTAPMTIGAIEAARRALAEVDGRTRIDVVDNDSQDGSYERLCEAARERGWGDEVVVLQSGHNGGFGAGNNFAIRRALAEDEPPELIYLLNSDAFPEPDAVAALARFMDSHPEVGIAGSALHGADDGEPHETVFRFPTLTRELVCSVRLGLLMRFFPDGEVAIRPRPAQTRQVDWLAGASMMIRREVLESVGLFDETFFLYFEETDLCRRARLQGWPTYFVPDSRVAHVGHASTGLKDKSQPMPRYWFDSRRHYFRKNHGRAYTWATNAAHALGLASFRVRSRIQSKPDPDPAHFLRDFVRYNFLEQRP